MNKWSMEILYLLLFNIARFIVLASPNDLIHRVPRMLRKIHTTAISSYERSLFAVLAFFIPSSLLSSLFLLSINIL